MLRWTSQLTKPTAPGLAGFVLLGLAGCASPGVPRPPSLHLPALVRDLSAIRVGNSIELHFTAPDQTTDHQALVRKGVPVPLTAVVCRVQGAACLGVARLFVRPDQAVQVVDALPPPLTIGAVRAIAYRVRVENAAGRDAGNSREALAAAGVAPAPITGLTATTVARGIQLSWQPLPLADAAVRVEAATVPSGTGSKAADKAAGTGAAPPRVLQVPLTSQHPGGAVDLSPEVGAHLTYRVYRQRSVVVDGRTLSLQGEAATVSTVRTADVFPPPAPTGLLAVSFLTESGGASVSLSWEPGDEPDLAGYRVYRAIGQGTFKLLTEHPVTGVSFQDTAAAGLQSGTRVRYVLTAVDRAGNESARSAVAEVDVH